MEDIMTIFIARLNDNTLGLKYDGNFLFQFHDEKLTILEQETGKLVLLENDYSPVAMPVKECTPYSEKNKRRDWLIEFNILARIQGAVYDSTVDLDYDNINAKTYAMDGLSLTSGGKKYSFKTRPVREQGYVTLGNSKYVLLAVVMNITEILTGYFGQDSVITLTYGTTIITPDVIEFGKVATRRYYTGDKKSTATNDYNKAIGRAMSFTLKINYNDETQLLAEVNGKSTIAQQYTLTEVFNSTTETWTVTCEQASEIQSVNGVKKFSFIFKEAV